MRSVARPIIVGVAVLGLAGFGAVSAHAGEGPPHHGHGSYHKTVNKKNTEIEDNDRVISKSILFGGMDLD
ncbi:hypothetical protein [Streptomyces daliensis]|uniref:Uncharacterized protein n=1 Tax=Streptomyces daliensis TaxID=299421 RepID=A0A8T4IU00_9ACTN|nr:hypothetical protein [Streptomyces daliensis]